MHRLNAARKTKPLYAALNIYENATSEEIQTAFWTIARKHHPDVNGGVADETYQKAAHAYSVLKDPAARAAYDDSGIDPGDTPRSLERTAVDMIVAAAFQCIVDSGGDGNLVEQIKAALRIDLRQVTIELLRIDMVINKTAKARSSIEKRWKGADAPRSAVLAMIDEQQAKDKNARAIHQQKSDLLDLALEILEPASYAAAQPSPPPPLQHIVASSRPTIFDNAGYGDTWTPSSWPKL